MSFLNIAGVAFLFSMGIFTIMRSALMEHDNSRRGMGTFLIGWLLLFLSVVNAMKVTR